MQLSTTSKPYATSIARQRALYRIADAPAPNRTLEIRVTSATPGILDGSWPGARRVQCTLTADDLVHPHQEDGCESVAALWHAPLPFAAQSFDRIVLHGTLDSLIFAGHRDGKPFDPVAYIKRIVELLVPGGVVIAQVDNRLHPREIAAALRSGAAAKRAYFTISRCRAILRESGLCEGRIFNLLPDGESPIKLVELDARTARLVFVRELETRREALPAWSYWARRASVDLGLAARLEKSFLFWGYRPC